MKDDPTKQASVIIAILLTILMVVVAYLCSGGSANGSSSSRTCQSCGRSFTDSSNISSIKKTNMCKNCYGNFEWGMKATGQ